MGGVAMGWMWVWPVLLFIGIAAIVAAGMWLAAGRRSSTAEGTDRARLILDERFARGEIDEEEYRRRRTELR